MSCKEFFELLKYIEENHSWKNMFENQCIKNRNVKVIKYVNFDFDTRDSQIWQVTFRQVMPGKNKTFREMNDNNLKEEIYNWLKEEVVY